jgi:RNA polymerase sigma-70 factor (ECF subfamily)
MVLDLAHKLRKQVSKPDIVLLFQTDLDGIETAEQRGQLSSQFTSLYTAHRKSIEVYLRTLLPTATDVEDVFQETSLVLWREFPAFKIGTNFTAWAYKIAFNRVRAWRTRQSREGKKLSDTLTLEISDELISARTFHDARLAALSGCIQALKPHHRELLRRRYERGESVESIARSIGQSEEAIYKMLSRIRRQLFDSVTHQVNGSE